MGTFPNQSYDLAREFTSPADTLIGLLTGGAGRLATAAPKISRALGGAGKALLSGTVAKEAPIEELSDPDLGTAVATAGFGAAAALPFAGGLRKVASKVSDSDLLRKYVEEGAIPTGKELPRLVDTLVRRGDIPKPKKFEPELMKEVLGAHRQRTGLADEIKRLKGTEFALSPDEDIPQAWQRFVSHLTVHGKAGIRPDEDKIKSGWQAWNQYKADTGLSKAEKLKSGKTKITTRPDIERIEKNLSGKAFSATTKWLGNLGQLSKSYVLTSGVPLTGVNIHGFSIAKRALSDPQGSFVKTIGRIVEPGSFTSKRALGNMQDEILDAAKAGVNFTTELQVTSGKGGKLRATRGAKFTDVFSFLPSKLTKGMDKLGDFQERTFGAPLMENVLPLTKIESFKGHVGDLLKQGMSPSKARFEAAKITNRLYGGIDQKALVWAGKDGQIRSRSTELQDILRAAALAPDWLETNRATFIANVPKPLLRSFNKLMGSKEINMLSDTERKTASIFNLKKASRAVVGTYMAGTLLQKATTGKWIHENPSGRKWDIMTPMKDDKQKNVYVPLGLGTADDFARLPVELASSAFEGEIPDVSNLVRGRMSQPTKFMMNFLKGSDYLNRPLYGTDRYGRDIPYTKGAQNIGRELLDVFLPQYPEAAFNYQSGQYSPQQAITQALELPVKYHKPYNPNRRRRSRRRRRRRQ